MYPDYLYKYRAPNEYMIDSLQNQNMYFSYPKEFNDPFDCRIAINYKGQKTLWLEWLKKQKTPFDKKQQIRNYIKSERFDPSTIDKSPTNEMNTQVIHCLSSVYDNLLMWSHYSENHKGICIGYRIQTAYESPCIYFDDKNVEPFSEKITNGAVPIFKVDYQKDMPTPIDFFDKKEDAIVRFLKTKAVLWKYEKKWRLIYPANKIKNQLITIQKKLIQKIYLGARIEEKIKSKVLEVIDKEYLSKGFNIEVFQLSLSDEKYSLSEEKLTI